MVFAIGASQGSATFVNTSGEDDKAAEYLARASGEGLCEIWGKLFEFFFVHVFVLPELNEGVFAQHRFGCWWVGRHVWLLG